ncbi:lipocalin family protein [Psychrobium sp. 1_MG-2023]|uniref:lipocalin family protein n=1 Tax=Psychrobium sp. 1_MG-2023 TaxID=3062624 RepID=UPI000C3455D3|nr:lipocalin family protein [Psychrobium sp. 1_MG-2023]MDP2562150.1 lipocalin family protein [Psychrobium sp. 1_MG-2023]PKF57212.1 lipocalin [Alteromonadales bacterium alter-6D02]
MKALMSLLFLVSLVGCTGLPDGVSPVKNFNLEKYQGKWFEIARLDHSFERGLEQITAQYTIKQNGDVEVINRGFSTADKQWQQATGVAKFVETSDIGYLKVSFFRPFYGSYIIFGLDDDYQHAFVSGPDTSYLWFLSRTTTPPPKVMQQFITQASALGFDVDKLIYPAHPLPLSDK